MTTISPETGSGATRGDSLGGCEGPTVSGRQGGAQRRAGDEQAVADAVVLTLTDAKNTTTVARALDKHVMSHSTTPLTFGRATASLARDGSWSLSLPGLYTVHGYCTSEAVSIITDWAREEQS